jgi:hypothetical protein
MPYKEHVENLIDDEKYRDEITFFSLDQELGQVIFGGRYCMLLSDSHTKRCERVEAGRTRPETRLEVQAEEAHRNLAPRISSTRPSTLDP